MSTAKVLKPTPIVDALFVTSSLTEADAAAWSSGTTYGLGALVMYQHAVYESLQGGNTNHLPTETNSEWWLRLRPTNRWAMFDTQNSTASTGATNATVTTTVAPGVCNGCAVIGISGAASVRVQMVNGSTTVFDQTQTLDNTFISNWYEYFFEPYDIKSDLLFGPFPPYASAQITLTVTPTTGQAASIGGWLLGNTVELGTTQMGATVGIVDYSRVENDEFGVSTIVRRDFARRASIQLWLDNTQLRRVHSTLADLRATPAVWVCSEDYDYSPLVIYGMYRDFAVEIAHPTMSICSLELQGLT